MQSSCHRSRQGRGPTPHQGSFAKVLNVPLEFVAAPSPSCSKRTRYRGPIARPAFPPDSWLRLNRCLQEPLESVWSVLIELPAARNRRKDDEERSIVHGCLFEPTLVLVQPFQGTVRLRLVGTKVRH